ncbi:MAG: S9 family peptidase [Acidipila sp.]|nr:S9 family peptidase [Acidipila sp.]
MSRAFTPVQNAARRLCLRLAIWGVMLMWHSPAVWAQAHSGGAATASLATPPVTRRDNVKDVVHGVEIVDAYRWLEDQKSPETRAWIDAQNAYTDAILSKLPGREEWRRKLRALLKNETVSAPVVRNNRYFISKRAADEDQAKLYVRKGYHGADQLLLDPLPLSADHRVSFSIEAVSNDGALLLYQFRQGGEDETTPHLFDVDAGKDLPDKFPRATYISMAIKADKSAVYYAKQTAEGPRVYVHKPGSEAADVEIFGKGNGPDKIIALDISEDGRTLLIYVVYGSGSVRNDVYVQDLTKAGPIVPVVNDTEAQFTAVAVGDQLYVLTNWKAPKGRIVAFPASDLNREHWREVVPESTASIESFSMVGGQVAVLALENALTHLKLYAPTGKLLREVELPTIGSPTALLGRWGSAEAFYSFNSFHIPTTVYRYDVASGRQEIWSQMHVPIESDQFEVHQVWYKSKDGTRVPMLVGHKRGLKLDGNNPVLLTGYGGFDVSESASYGARAAAWMMSGGVYALANLRGGAEFGEAWHQAGMLAKKQNVFDDFIAAAEWLIHSGYTRPSRLAITGGSNGGLLVGAALTQRPDLFGAVICAYPLLDMVRYHQFLVAKWWVPEYGSSEDAEQFKYLYAYSPYHQVKPGTNYPAVLFLTGDADTRVAPLHARKMTAILQAASASGKPILLHYDTKAGHVAVVPVATQVDDLADQLGFLFWQLGVSPALAAE